MNEPAYVSRRLSSAYNRGSIALLRHDWTTHTRTLKIVATARTPHPAPPR